MLGQAEHLFGRSADLGDQVLVGAADGLDEQRDRRARRRPAASWRPPRRAARRAWPGCACGPLGPAARSPRDRVSRRAAASVMAPSLGAGSPAALTDGVTGDSLTPHKVGQPGPPSPRERPITSTPALLSTLDQGRGRACSGAPGDELVTIEQASQRYRVSPKTLRRRLGRDEIPGAFKRPGPTGTEWALPIASLEELGYQRLARASDRVIDAPVAGDDIAAPARRMGAARARGRGARGGTGRLCSTICWRTVRGTAAAQPQTLDQDRLMIGRAVEAG